MLRRLTQRGPSPEGWRQTPTTLIWGEADSWMPLMHGESLQTHYPELQLEITPNAGHNVMETHPEVFHELLVAAIGRSLTPF